MGNIANDRRSPATSLIHIAAFHPRVQGNLRGYVSVVIPANDVTIHNIGVYAFGPDWHQIRLPVPARPVFFAFPHYLDERSARQFEEAVLAALRAAYPTALTGRERAA